jgi:hypothetical protein
VEKITTLWWPKIPETNKKKRMTFSMVVNEANNMFFFAFFFGGTFGEYKAHDG